MTGIVFSKNRAMQLDCFLKSFQIYALPVFDELAVIYQADEEFKESYSQLNHSFAKFIKQGDLKADVINILEKAGKYSCFFVDDDMFHKPVNTDIFSCMADDVLCASLRLGLNTTYCYPLSNTQRTPAYQALPGNLMKWLWKTAHLDFAYPFSTDGHIFRTKDLLKAIREIDFKTPNELEDMWQGLVVYCGCEYMISYQQSRMTNVPANVAQTAYPNRHEGGSAKDLEHLFQQGYRIDLDAMDFSKVNGAHTPLELKFKKC